MSGDDRRTALRARLEHYYDAAPRAAARVEQHGPFTLFVGTGAWPYYARPRLGLTDPVTVGDVATVRARQRELGVPEQVEWQVEVTPSLSAACAGAGLAVHEHALMVLAFAVPTDAGGAQVRVLGPDDDLAGALAAQSRGFGGDGRVGAEVVAFLRDRVARGLSVVAVAEADGAAACVGMHQPVGGVSEVVGVATVPAYRRRGLAAAVTAALAHDARQRGVATVFLTAADDAVARIYAALGFRTVGSGGVAGPAPSPSRPLPSPTVILEDTPATRREGAEFLQDRDRRAGAGRGGTGVRRRGSLPRRPRAATP